MREALWDGIRQLRRDGPDSKYLSIGLGRAGELMTGAKPDQTALVRVIDEETIEIKLVSPEYDADEEGEHD